MPREFKCYDGKGVEYAYDTAIDQHQAMMLAGYTLTPPGTPEPPTADPMRAYEKLSAEELRKLCAGRRIKGYVTMNRDEQVQALRDSDAAMAEKLNAKSEKGK